MSRKNPSFIETLLRAKHDKTFLKLKDFKVVIRGSGTKEKIIDGSLIIDLDRSHFEYCNKGGEIIHIPQHRIKGLLCPSKTSKKG